MADKSEPTQPAPIINSPAPDAEDVKKVRTTKRSDAAQAFIQNWLSGHPVAASAFTDADAVALVEAVDAAK